MLQLEFVLFCLMSVLSADFSELFSRSQGDLYVFFRYNYTFLYPPFDVFSNSRREAIKILLSEND